MFGITGPQAPDRRVRRTRRAVQQALVELILEKGYDAVTVTDVIGRADVGRSTFYAHFTGKQEVLFSNLDELVRILHPVPRAAPAALFSFSLPMFEHVREQGRLVRALIGRRGGTTVVAHAEQVLAAVVREELLASLPDGRRPPESLDLVVTGIVGAFMALVREWVDGDFTATPAVLNDAFLSLVVPGAEALLAQAPGAGPGHGR
ncbi:TetR/AcrR family transcriptional regulator [Sphaerisporangium aureirubrum]|uniref:TetR/AcrR family transcriptional regulator n=1 Tax=Sphaerisporangium aureirubrum TaxID=1544736 RepID=A0ABW1NJB5_9ACTN